MKVFPNPTNDVSVLSIKLDNALPLKFELFDANGKLLNSNQEWVSTITYYHEIDLTRLPAGNYYLHLSTISGSALGTFPIVRN